MVGCKSKKERQIVRGGVQTDINTKEYLLGHLNFESQSSYKQKLTVQEYNSIFDFAQMLQF